MASDPKTPLPKQPKKNDPKDPQGKWRRPIIVWVLLAVMIFSIISVFKDGAPGISGAEGGAQEPLNQLAFWERVNKGVEAETVDLKDTENARAQATAEALAQQGLPTKVVQVKGNAELPKVTLVRESDNATFLEGKWADGTPLHLNLLGVQNIEERLANAGVKVTQENRTNFWGPILISILPIALMFLFFYIFFFRQMRGGSGENNPFSFGKSRARMLSKEEAKIRFSDVAGVDEAKEEVQEIVDFLKEPKRFEAVGGRVPKGVLLMGPPGTGKTLLAKAIAGEAGVPFFSISGSDFVEMFVGVGASRVRDMFAQAKKNAPCILFIDEIDAIGRTRFTGIGGGHDEREQTLNAMLVEMDGFEGNSGVIVMAATNRVDVLDPALTRPGRFDRQIVVDLPTVEGRVAILKVHAKKIKLGEDVDLERIARGTPGFSGADLANLLNEAALLAAREKRKAVTHSDLEEARDKVLWGRERKSHAMADRDRRITAWHEGGHALAQVLLENTEPLHKVTIIPRGRALGATMSLPERDVLNRTLAEMKDMLVVMTAGRIAEKLFTGDLSTGASQDIKMATHLARRMICTYGMSEVFGFQSFGDNEDQVYLGRDMGRKEDHSEATAQTIDAEVAKLLKEAYARGEKLINDHRDRLELLVDYLLEVETADGRDVEKLIKTGEKPAPKPKEQPMETTARVIAIDGPSGAGKSSVSREVGKRLGFLHVDSGALYRIVTWQCLEHNIDTSKPEEVAAFAQQLKIEAKAEDGRIVYELDGVRPEKELREPRINAHASPVATVPEVRKIITDFLRDLVKFGDLIVEGRDITTAVFPDTPARFYLEADAAVRAQRRQLEEVEKGVANQSVEAVKESLLARDKIDSSRACAPLRKADGVYAIDSTYLTLEQVIETVLAALPKEWLPTPPEAPSETPNA